MLANTATKPKLLIVKRLSDTHWSARYDAVRTLTLSYHEYIDLLEVKSTDDENRSELKDEAKGLVEKLGQLETCILLTMWSTILERFEQTSSALQREGSI